MSRRDEWSKVRDSITGSSRAEGKTIEERERMPEKACGCCQNFFESANESDGRGSCRILKMGSDIKANPPVIVTSGEAGLIAYINTDADKCPHFLKMEIIDHDLGEISDPRYRRVHRIMEKT
jgi:hypothetical protein